MKVYVTEEEQIERIKNWVKEYGTTVIGTVILVVAISFGWRYWQGRQEMIRAQASSAYEEMVISLVSNQPQLTTLKAKYVLQEYPKTPYAMFAAFELAREAVNARNYAEADKQFQWVITHTKDPSIIEVAKIRDARVLAAMGKTQQALSILNTAKQSAFTPEVNEVKGDIYTQIGNMASAKQAYQSALSGEPKSDAMRPLVQMKLADLARVMAITQAEK